MTTGGHIAPIQVGDPRKKASPNQTQDSNNISALDDLNRETMQRSTRADTQAFMRETN